MFGNLEVFSDVEWAHFHKEGRQPHQSAHTARGAALKHLLFVLKAHSLDRSAEPVAPIQPCFLRSGIIILFYLPDSCFLFFLAQEEGCLLKMKKKKKNVAVDPTEFSQIINLLRMSM